MKLTDIIVNPISKTTLMTIYVVGVVNIGDYSRTKSELQYKPLSVAYEKINDFQNSEISRIIKIGSYEASKKKLEDQIKKNYYKTFI